MDMTEQSGRAQGSVAGWFAARTAIDLAQLMNHAGQDPGAVADGLVYA
jgi:hypothetical protein